jgi:hypothetical protein
MSVRVRGSPSRHYFFIAILLILVVAIIVVTVILGPDLVAMIRGQMSWNLAILFYPAIMAFLLTLLVEMVFRIRYSWDLLILSDTNLEKDGESFSYDYISQAQFNAVEEQIVLILRVPIGRRRKTSRIEIPKELAQPSMEALIDMLNKHGVEIDGSVSFTIDDRIREDEPVKRIQEEKQVGVPTSGRLLYAESRSTYLEGKFVVLGGSVILFALIILALVASVVAAEKYDIRLLLGGLFYGTVATVILLFMIFPCLSWQRPEIYDDRIALPRPRRPSLLRYKPETVMKDDILKAEFQTKPNGGWRCTITFKNGEVFDLNSSFVQCEEECEPAMREFLRGLLNEGNNNGDGSST